MSVTTSPEELQTEADQFREEFQTIRDAVGQVIVGQEAVVEATLTAILCGGNVLLEGVPGLGKTELVKALSRVLELHFRRIQFTPDLMPADVIGTNIMTSDESGSYRFEFRQGPVFTQLLLADEINRATPKTQSALLETMQEGTVTVGGETRYLEQPFFVLATQNPDRTGRHVPSAGSTARPLHVQSRRAVFVREELNEVVSRTILAEGGRRPQSDRRTADSASADGARSRRRERCDARLCLSACAGDSSRHRVRSGSRPAVLRWGASPRAAQASIRAARVRALSQGRPHVAFEDIRYFAAEVLQHRALLNYDGQAENIAVADLIEECVKSLPTNAD